MKTVEVEIEREEGKIEKVKMKCLKRKYTKKLRKDFGIKYDQKTKEVLGDYEGYTEKALSMAITFPVDLASVEALDELEDVEFNKLQKGYHAMQKLTKEEKSFLSEQ